VAAHAVGDHQQRLAVLVAVTAPVAAPDSGEICNQELILIEVSSTGVARPRGLQHERRTSIEDWRRGHDLLLGGERV
jgi:hypothetical protein